MMIKHFCTIDSIAYDERAPGTENCCCVTQPYNAESNLLGSSAIVTISLIISSLMVFSVLVYTKTKFPIIEKYTMVQ
jgi:hypothetical protein